MAAKKHPSAKATTKKRSLNAGAAGPRGGSSFQEQDIKRRLGNFEGAGEHSRVGGRTTGVVGQTKKKFNTDKKKK